MAKPEKLQLHISSFGYKAGPVPEANVVFDVRFLKNPYWVEDLRPLSGLDQEVRDYVMEQEAARDFVEAVQDLITKMIPRLVELQVPTFSIAFGCTGGQHRSATIVEVLAARLKAEDLTQLEVNSTHRELAAEGRFVGAAESRSE